MPFDKAQREHVCPCGVGSEPCPRADGRLGCTAPLETEHTRLLGEGWQLGSDGCYRKGDDEHCPKCGEECWRDSADVGVGIIYGPWGCAACGWSESETYDLSEGKDPIDERGGVTDQFGNYYPPGNTVSLAYRMARDAEKSIPPKQEGSDQ